MGLTIFLSCVVVAFYGLFMAALITKYLEMQRASLWIAAPAKIVHSKSEARKVDKRTGSEGNVIKDTEIRNFAAIRYTFKAGDRQITGRRISISEDPGNYQVAEKLERYPVGANVTVYYDAARPENCVLERDMQAGSFKTALVVGTLVGLGGLGIIFFFSGMSDWLGRAGIASGVPTIVFPLTIMGLLVAAFGLALHRRGQATFHWSKVNGVIVSSTVDSVKRRLSLDLEFSRRSKKLFRDRTRYAYKVSGVSYESDRVSYGAQFYASFRLLARLGAKRFGEGQQVEVYYNPAAPAQAVLRPGAPGQVFVWLAAAMLLGAAAHFGGWI